MQEYTILQTSKSISDSHRMLYDKLARTSEEIDITCGYQGDSRNITAQYNRKEDFWWYEEKLDTRYWNVFGLGEPSLTYSNSILAEINYPISGINRHVAAALVKDSSGRIHVAHSGRLGGSAPKGFKNHLSARVPDGWIHVDYQDKHGKNRFWDLFLISEIDIPGTRLARNIAAYLGLVDEFKNSTN